MSVGIDDESCIDIDAFVGEFESWYHENGQSLNPYDAAEGFIDYYAHRVEYLPFARKKLMISYILNGTYISILSLTIATFIAIFISQITENFILTWWFVSITSLTTICHFITRIIFSFFNKTEHKVSIRVINLKFEIKDIIFPNGVLADFINSLTKQRMDEDPVPNDDQDVNAA